MAIDTTLVLAMDLVTISALDTAVFIVATTGCTSVTLMPTLTPMPVGWATTATETATFTALVTALEASVTTVTTVTEPDTVLALATTILAFMATVLATEGVVFTATGMAMAGKH